MKNIQDMFYKTNLNKEISLTFNIDTFKFDGTVTLVSYDKYVLLIKYSGIYYLINKNNILHVKGDYDESTSFKPKHNPTITYRNKKEK